MILYDKPWSSKDNLTYILIKLGDSPGIMVSKCKKACPSSGKCKSKPQWAIPLHTYSNEYWQVGARIWSKRNRTFVGYLWGCTVMRRQSPCWPVVLLPGAHDKNWKQRLLEISGHLRLLLYRLEQPKTEKTQGLQGEEGSKMLKTAPKQ